MNTLGLCFSIVHFAFHFSGLYSVKPELYFLLNLRMDVAKNLGILYVCVWSVRRHIKCEAMLNVTSLLLQQMKAELPAPTS